MGKAKKIVALAAVLAAGAAGVAYALKKDKEDKEMADLLNRLKFKKCKHTDVKTATNNCNEHSENKESNIAKEKEGSAVEVVDDEDTTTSVEESDVNDSIDYEKETRDVVRKINDVLRASGLTEERDCENCCSDCHKRGTYTENKETDED